MALNKPLDSIEESDLQQLIDNQFPEGKTIEYKKALPGNSDGDKKEFLADVSSFANAAGGDLIFGIREDSGVPVELHGLQVSDVDAEILRLESIIQTGIAPRLFRMVEVQPVSLQSKRQRYAIVIRIRKSWISPHMVISNSKFFTRNSRGKYQLDVSELRTAFVLSETTTERIRNFRAERLSNIVGGVMPTRLEEKAPKIVLHIVPFGAFDPALRFDVNSLYGQRELLDPFAWQPRDIPNLLARQAALDNRYNFDGFLISRFFTDWNSPAAYTQVFRNGSVEAVDTSILARSGERRIIYGAEYERRLLLALKRYLEAQKSLGVEPPLFVMLSFLGINDYTIEHDSPSEPNSHIDRADLIVPEIMIDRFDVEIAEAMKPAFDTIWNAAGWQRSMIYDESGKSLHRL